MKETREQKFKRLANLRTNAVLDKLRILGNLSNRANYSYSDDQVRRIFKTIESQLKSTKARFTIKEKKKFKL